MKHFDSNILFNILIFETKVFLVTLFIPLYIMLYLFIYTVGMVLFIVSILLYFET